MATTWGQYSWGDNAWSSATNIIPVSGQVATLTLGTDHVSTPDVGWSSNAWGHNSWGSNTNLIPVTGQLLSAVLDSATAFSSAGWGALNWSHGTWGSVNVGLLVLAMKFLNLVMVGVEKVGEVEFGMVMVPFFLLVKKRHLQ